MKISCPACSAKYSIADDKVADRLAKIKCRKCGATIVIDGKASPPNVYTAAGEATDASAVESNEAAAAGPQYTVDFGEGDQRTMSIPEIVTAYQAKQLTRDTYLWADGFDDWKPLADVDEVASAVTSAAAGRTARAAVRPAAQDLFGGLDAAGSEEDVTTSAPEHSPAAAAVIPATSSGLGLGLGLGSSSNNSLGTGQRNESSVLFSLSALTSAATRPSSRPMATAASAASSRDDSGLIDLKALTAAATKSEVNAAPALVTAPLGLSPLAAPPLGITAPLGAPAMDLAPAAQKSRAPMFIGGGLVLAALIVAGAVLLRPEPPPPAPPPVVAAPAPTPTPSPAPAPTPEVTATPPATGTAQADAAPQGDKPAVPKRNPSTGGTKKPAPAAEKPATPAPDKTAAPKPKKNACGCAPADLQCAMRCAAG